MNKHIISQLRNQHPIVFTIANTVTSGKVADGLSALGISPIMSLQPTEALELAKLAQAVVINLGTPYQPLEAEFDNGAAAATSQEHLWFSIRSLVAVLLTGPSWQDSYWISMPLQSFAGTQVRLPLWQANNGKVMGLMLVRVKRTRPKLPADVRTCTNALSCSPERRTLSLMVRQSTETNAPPPGWRLTLAPVTFSRVPLAPYSASALHH